VTDRGVGDPGGGADERVLILGAGRAGRGIARALRAAGVTVALHGRRAERGPDEISAGELPAALDGATVALVAVQDAHLDGAVDQLLAARPVAGAAVLHASGSAEPASLDRARAAGYAAGTFHPLLPLADPAHAPELFRGAYVGVDGDDDAVAVARRLAARLGARALTIPRGEKARYHAAAVIASNFPAVLAALAERLLGASGIEREDARRAVLGLMGAAVANLRELPPAAALTGPVVRGDADTVRRHLAALETDRGAREAYVALSRAALALVREAAGAAPGSAEIERMLLTSTPSSPPDRTP
jgi:predicted short-subunit dehydrogenase-like oxidoreductase (DUF2520 family)